MTCPRCDSPHSYPTHCNDCGWHTNNPPDPEYSAHTLASMARNLLRTKGQDEHGYYHDEAARQAGIALKQLMARVQSLAETGEQVRAAVIELVRLKDLKERMDVLETYVPGASMESEFKADVEYEELSEEYERCKPLAWAAARALATQPPQQEQRNEL